MDESARKLISGSIIVTVGAILSAVCFYVFRIILTLHLSVEKIGLFFSMLSLFIFLGIFQKLGSDFGIVRFITMWAHEQKNTHIQKGIIALAKFQVVIGLILMGVVIYFSKLLSTMYFKEEAAILPLCIFSLILLALILDDLSRRVFQGVNDMIWFTGIDLFKSILLIICILVGFSVSDSIMVPIISFLIASVCTGLVGFAIILWKYPSLLLTKKGHPQSNTKLSAEIEKELPSNNPEMESTPSPKKIFKEIFLYSIPLVFIVIGNRAIESLDLLTLTYYSTLDQVGIYSIVILTSSLGLFLFRPVASVIMPITTSLWVKNEHARINSVRNNVHKYLYTIMIPIISLLFLFSQEILYLFFGVQYISGAVALQIVLCGVIFYGLANINLCMLSSMNHSKKAGMVMIYATLIAALLNFTLIPHFGMIGAAISTTFAYIATYLLSNHFLKILVTNNECQKDEKKEVGKIILLFLYSIITVSWIIVQSHHHIGQKIEYSVLFLIGYLILVTIVKMISFTEIKDLIKQGTSKE